MREDKTRNSPGDEIANVNFFYDDIVYMYYKIQFIIAHKFRHRSTLFVARHRPMTVFTAGKIQ